jgi:integrase
VKGIAYNACRKIAEGMQAADNMSAGDAHRLARLDAMLLELCKNLGKDITLDSLVAEACEAKQTLKGGSLRAAADHYQRTAATVSKQGTVAETYDQFIAVMEAEKSDARAGQFRTYIGRKFVPAFGLLQITDLTPALVSQWLTELKLADTSKKLARDCVKNFSDYLALHGYLAKGTSLVDGVQTYEAAPAKKEIWTPAEAATILTAAAGTDFLAFAALQVFCGIRGKEIQRLNWTDVILDGDEPHVVVDAPNSKTEKRRLPSLCAAALAWLKTIPAEERTGKVCRYASESGQIDKLTRKIQATSGNEDFVWKFNACRHSAVSYAMATTSNIAKVADEAGHDEVTCRKHYLKRVSKAEAKKYFSCFPPQAAGNVVSLKAA